MTDAFAEVARQYPDYPALVHNGCVLSYHQLNLLVQAVTLRLGRQPGVVGVYARRSPETIVGLLGVLVAGGTYCPIDPTFPVIRQESMMVAVGCRTVLDAETDLRLSTATDKLSNSGPAAPITEPTAPASAGPEPGSAPDPAAAAYILFTSGSTGAPKPVLTPRRAIAEAVGSLRELFELTPSDRVLQFASLNWDTCFEEILPALTTGAALVLHDEAHSGSFPRFLRMIERERISVLDLPTAFWHELVHHLAEDRIGLPDCVRLVVIGGEAASPARLAEWCALDTGRIRLVNTYGCTETTLVTHAVDLHGPRATGFDPPWERTGRVPIGHPLPHVIEHVSDEGELSIGGPALALGYLGAPEATRTRFVDTGSGRHFRTGDRVSRSADGTLVHQGRLDNEVKVRGIRVDPAEVEAQIAGHPAVGAVAVVAVTAAGRTMLVAYVVPRFPAGGGALDAELRAYLRTRVPGHLVPGRITVVPSLVHTASGKVDRAGSHQRHAP